MSQKIRSTIVIEHDDSFDIRSIEMPEGASIIAENYGLDAKAKIDQIAAAMSGLPEDHGGSGLDGFEWVKGAY